jgi:hypothetical protein
MLEERVRQIADLATQTYRLTILLVRVFIIRAATSVEQHLGLLPPAWPRDARMLFLPSHRAQTCICGQD